MQDEPATARNNGTVKAAPGLKRPRWRGHIFKMLLTILDLHPSSAPEMDGRNNSFSPSMVPPSHRQEHSFKNHPPAPPRHKMDLARRRGYGTSAHSLDNMLANRPSRITRDLPAASAIQDAATVKRVVKFYLVFLSAVAKRQEDVKGVQLQLKIDEAIRSARNSLPEDERWLLPAAGNRPLSEPNLSSIDGRMASGDCPALEVRRIRDVYVHALHELIGSLGERLDDSLVKLLFRLAARDALQEERLVAMKYSLLDGIPEPYLRQSGPSSLPQEAMGE